MLQIKSYDDMFRAIRALTGKKILKIRMSNQKFLQNESFFLKCFDLDCITRNDTSTKIAWHHSYSSKRFISKTIVCLLLNLKRW